MKKLIASLCAALACSFLFTATPVQAKTTNYEMTLTKSYQRIWSNGTNKIYMTTNKDYTKQKSFTMQATEKFLKIALCSQGKNMKG